MKRRRVMLLMIGAGLIGTAVVVLWSKAKEPEYKGKKLSDWVLACEPRHYPLDDVEWNKCQEAREAIRQIGTNAFPYALKWIRYKPASWRRRIEGSKVPIVVGFSRNPVVRRVLLSDRANDLANNAITVFRILATNAGGVKSELYHLVGSSDFLSVLASNDFESIQVWCRASSALTEIDIGVGLASKKWSGSHQGEPCVPTTQIISNPK